MLSVTVHFFRMKYVILRISKLSYIYYFGSWNYWKLGVKFSSVIACGCNKHRQLTVSGL